MTIAITGAQRDSAEQGPSVGWTGAEMNQGHSTLTAAAATSPAESKGAPHDPPLRNFVTDAALGNDANMRQGSGDRERDLALIDQLMAEDFDLLSRNALPKAHARDLAGNAAPARTTSVGDMGGVPVASQVPRLQEGTTPGTGIGSGVARNDSQLAGLDTALASLSTAGRASAAPVTSGSGTLKPIAAPAGAIGPGNSQGPGPLIDTTTLPPIAGNDAYTVPHDQELDVDTGTGVLANDRDPGGQPLTANLVGRPSHGMLLQFNTDGFFIYQPNGAYVGMDSFTYKANDGTADSNVATVTISVTNRAPFAGNDTFSLVHNIDYNDLYGTLSGAVDPDGDSLQFSKDSNPTHGSLNLSDDGTFTYLPNPSFVGTDSFTYHVNDGAASSNTGTVTINVIDVLPIAGNATIALFRNGFGGGTLNNSAGPDAADLQFFQDSNVSNGSLDFGSDGSFSYAPDDGFIGTVSFTYHVNDGALSSNIATVTIEVLDPHGTHAPVASDDVYGVLHDHTLNETYPPAGVLGNDGSPDGRPLQAVLDSTTTNGQLTLHSDGTFQYAPYSGFVGTDRFTYHANDGLSSNEATVTILVTNQAPTAGDDSYAVLHDETLNVTYLPIDLLANDGDPDGDPLQLVQDSAPANGSLTLNANGTFTYVPNAGYVGTDSFTYHVSDGITTSNEATVSIVVSDLTPVASDNTYLVLHDTSLAVSPSQSLLNNADDPDGDPLTVVMVNSPNHGILGPAGMDDVLTPGGEFTYTPDTGYTGLDSFTYQVDDGISQSAVATVTILVTNRAPTAGNSSFTTGQDVTLTTSTTNGVLANAQDADGDPLSASLVNNVSHGVLNLSDDGSFIYVPAPNFYGTDSFTYSVSDGVDSSNVATATITVTPKSNIDLDGADALPGATWLSDTDKQNPGVLVNVGTSTYNAALLAHATGHSDWTRYITWNPNDLDVEGVPPDQPGEIKLDESAGDVQLTVFAEHALPASGNFLVTMQAQDSGDQVKGTDVVKVVNPKATIQTLQFTSDQGVIRKNTTNYLTGGNLYPAVQWNVATKDNAPVTQQAGTTQKVSVKLTLNVGNIANNTPYTLTGTSTETALNFTQSGNLAVTGTSAVITVTATNALGTDIRKISATITWSLVLNPGGNQQTLPLGQTGPHVIYTTWGTPVVTNAASQVTDIRMARTVTVVNQAIQGVKGTGKAPSPARIVYFLMGNSNFFLGRNLVGANAWTLPDTTGASCISISTFVSLVANMTGLPGMFTIKTYIATENAPNTAVEGDLSRTVRKNPANPKQYLALWDSHNMANSFEATVLYTIGGNTYYFPGGAGNVVYTNKDDVLTVFQSLGWGEFDSVAKKWKEVMPPIKTYTKAADKYNDLP